MVKEELIVGLQNGLTRGQSLEQAIESLISAGYNPDEVKEAANYANVGITRNMGMTNPATTKNIANNNSSQTQPTNSQIQSLPTSNVQPTQPKKKKIWLIVLIIFLVIAIITLGIFSLYGERILNALFPS